MGGRGMKSMSAWANGGVSAGGGSRDVTSKYRGMSLAQAEDTIRKIKDHEEAVVFDKDMKVIAAYSGDSGSVRLPSSLKSKQGITVTHNHPGGEAGYGATFSPADIAWFASSKGAEMRAVGSGKGEFVYSIQVRGKQSANSVKYAKNQLRLWAAKVNRDATPVSKGGTGKLQKDYDRYYRKHRKQGKSVEAAKHAAWQQATGKLERSLSDAAKQNSAFGALYFSKNRRYNVNR